MCHVQFTSFWPCPFMASFGPWRCRGSRKGGGSKESDQRSPGDTSRLQSDLGDISLYQVIFSPNIRTTNQDSDFDFISSEFVVLMFGFSLVFFLETRMPERALAPNGTVLPPSCSVWSEHRLPDLVGRTSGFRRDFPKAKGRVRAGPAQRCKSRRNRWFREPFLDHKASIPVARCLRVLCLITPSITKYMPGGLYVG